MSSIKRLTRYGQASLWPQLDADVVMKFLDLVVALVWKVVQVNAVRQRVDCLGSLIPPKVQHALPQNMAKTAVRIRGRGDFAPRNNPIAR